MRAVLSRLRLIFFLWLSYFQYYVFTYRNNQIYCIVKFICNINILFDYM